MPVVSSYVSYMPLDCGSRLISKVTYTVGEESREDVKTNLSVFLNRNAVGDAGNGEQRKALINFDDAVESDRPELVIELLREIGFKRIRGTPYSLLIAFGALEEDVHVSDENR